MRKRANVDLFGNELGERQAAKAAPKGPPKQQVVERKQVEYGGPFILKYSWGKDSPNVTTILHDGWDA